MWVFFKKKGNQMSIKKIYAERYKMVAALRKLEEEAEAQELMNERMNK